MMYKILFICLMCSCCTPIEREISEEVIEDLVEYEFGHETPKIAENMQKTT